MEASRAATGMLDVLATRQVRSIALYDTPSMRVSNSGKSFNTSAISFPRSPHPTYTMMSELDYLESDCEMTVLPQPNAPGTALVPPNTEGKIPSMTRCPVKRGVRAAKDSVTGLDSRTGHLWLKLNSCVFSPSASILNTFSTTLYSPLMACFCKRPGLALGGTMIACFLMHLFSKT